MSEHSDRHVSSEAQQSSDANTSAEQTRWDRPLSLDPRLSLEPHELPAGLRLGAGLRSGARTWIAFGSLTVAALLIAGVFYSFQSGRSSVVEERAAADESASSSASALAPAPVPIVGLGSEMTAVHSPSVRQSPTLAREAQEEQTPAPVPNPLFLADTGAQRVIRLQVATGIAGHEPVGTQQSLHASELTRVYAFVEAANETEDYLDLYVTFEPEQGESSGHVSLEVPANVPRWRTWAFTRNFRPGAWRAVVRDQDGELLASRAFEILE